MTQPWQRNSSWQICIRCRPALAAPGYHMDSAIAPDRRSGCAALEHVDSVVARQFCHSKPD